MTTRWRFSATERTQMPDRIDCPVPGCSGRLITKRLDTFGVAIFCDGPDTHSDTTIRNAYQRWDDELEAVDPDAADELLRKASPVEFLRDQVLAAAVRKSGRVRVPSKAMLVPPPSYPTGLGGIGDHDFVGGNEVELHFVSVGFSLAIFSFSIG